MAFWNTLRVGLFFTVITISSRQMNQPPGSQVPGPAARPSSTTASSLQVNPRVGDRSTPIPGTPSGVKQTGRGTPSGETWSASRKRAFRRARHRATNVGGTWYRGKWHSAQSLGVQGSAEILSQPTATVKSPPRHRQLPRLQVISYNIGGFTAEGYDVFVDWLDKRCAADIVMVQETHWGLGREEKRWLLPGWIVISSPDAAARCSGVAVFMRRRLFADQQVSHVTWIPGRLMHIRHSAAKLHLDIIVGYQWVWQDKHAERTAKLRHHFWHQLSLLLQGLPTRNVLVMGADLNTQCRTVPGLIGRGLLPPTRKPDAELEAMLRERQLVLLNTWGRAAPSRCKTFENGSVASQLDFIGTWRRHADSVARTATPLALDLVPWRKGPKHLPVQASIPWIPGWQLAPRPRAQPAYSRRDLNLAISQNTPEAQHLKHQLQTTLIELAGDGGFGDLNKRLLPVCQRLFPSRRRPGRGTERQRQVQDNVQALWAAHARLQVPGPFGSFHRASEAVRRQAAFKEAHQQLRRVSRQQRRTWFEEQVVKAEQAAATNDLRGVYAAVNVIAPRRRFEKVRIRSEQGQLLSVRQEFQEIYGYFSGAFSRDESFRLPELAEPLTFCAEEIRTAIQGLRKWKAVPPSSLPAEIWLLDIEAMTQYCTKVLNVSSEKGHAFPPETTHCSLSLLPKPGKTSRRPCDLRPLGLQDPGSKVLVNALKARVLAEAGEFLSTKPQFAYCPGKAIDGAISRVAQHCARVRHRIRRGTLSVHDRRQGHKESICFGGLMISLDLSRAFDEVPRQSLAQALTHAGISDSLQHAILSMHEDCQYEVKHEAHTASFPMLKGVRQGCSLAPLLFAIYSCWIYDKIEIRTPTGWAEKFLTLFADDSHLAFEIESMADLEQAQRTIRTVFQVFKSTGMRINPSKSKLVLGLRGSAARRWLRKHLCLLEGKSAISLGVPSEPLLIPRVNSMVYLGVVTPLIRDLSFRLPSTEL